MVKKVVSFYDVLSEAQGYISTTFAEQLENCDKQLLENHLKKFLDETQLEAADLTAGELLRRLMNEMTGYSFLTDYLGRTDVEEININSWYDTKVTYSSGEIVPTYQQFQNPDHAIDVVRRMLSASNMVWNASSCKQVGRLPGNIRISVAGFSLVDKETSLVVSIRQVNAGNLAREDYINGGLATEDMLDLVLQLFMHGVSTCFAGATGAGKSTLLAWVISQLPDHKRLITLEDGPRDFNCIRKAENGRVLNNVLHLSTRHSDIPKDDITLAKLLEFVMTMNPDYIAIGESKGEEAMQAVNAANTGHVVATTLHTQSAELTYLRLMSLCKMKYPNMSDSFLLRQVQQAFPIVVYLDCGEDHRRRIMAITEAVQQPDGSVRYVTLYEFVLQENVKTKDSTEVKGFFQKRNSPSEALKKQVISKGMTQEWINKIWGKEK